MENTENENERLKSEKKKRKFKRELKLNPRNVWKAKKNSHYKQKPLREISNRNINFIEK